jgi:crotonobetainyl-CoA:carnitine CoA-transferase CaiB-like acyl-CoA transferase
VLGEHTLEVLAEHGYTDAEIASLLQHKVVSAP